jgi:predicted dehydrogenase
MIYSKPKIGVIGKGYWGSKVINYVNNYFECAYHIGNNEVALNMLLNDSSVNNVMIITPIETHYDLCKRSLLHNKNVFCEKPITLYTDQAVELRELAKSKGLKLAVEYTHTFSRSIAKVFSFCLPEYGKIKYYEMNSKHLGRFMEHSVYWLLASHFLAVLDMFEDLGDFNFISINRLYYNDVCTTGTIEFEKGRIETSVNYTGKESNVVFYFENATVIYNSLLSEGKTLRITEYNNKYKAVSSELINKEVYGGFDESNNLKYAMEYFYKVISGKALSNIDTAIKITHILEIIGDQNNKQ